MNKNNNNNMSKQQQQPSPPPGYIYRRGYTRTTNSGSGRQTYVPGSFIKSTRAPGRRNQKRQVWASRVMAKKQAEHEEARNKFGTPQCGPNQTIREGYRNSRTGTLTPPQCIQRRGSSRSSSSSSMLDSSQKKNVIGPLEKGTLGKFGYTRVTSMSPKMRHRALHKAVKQYGYLPVFRKVNAVAVLTKNTAPETSNVMNQDKEWLRANKQKVLREK